MSNTLTIKQANALTIPVVTAGHALQSLRDSGHSLPTALGEVIDNSLEAKANTIQILLKESQNNRGKKHVNKIAFSDDGIGMDSNTLHRYPVLGFSTRYMHTDTIGKYGVGAKLAALNFGRRLDVWSRSSVKSPWLHVYFDLDEALEQEQSGDQAGIKPPKETNIPDDLLDITPSGTGTIVLWSRVDRLEEGRLAEDFNSLRLELEKELSRIFRTFIDAGIKIRINEKDLIAFDPLMLMSGDWSDFVLNKHYKKLSKKDGKNWKEKEFIAKKIATEEIKIGSSRAKVRISLYPKDVLRKRGKGADQLAKELRIPENEGAISFMRKGREVSYTIVPKILPGGIDNIDRFIGIEVSFEPDLDDYFGIRNVKRGVEPHGELRNRIRELLKKYIIQSRELIQEAWGEAARAEKDSVGDHDNIIEAAKKADDFMPKGQTEDSSTDQEIEQALDDLAVDAGFDAKEDKKQYLEKIKELPFVIESVDFPGKDFISIQHISSKVIIRLNTRHPFYREMWEPIKAISESDPGTVSGKEAVKTARRTIEALTLMVIAYGKAESMDPNPHDQYDDLRGFWGQFLSTLMKKVSGVS